MNCLRAKIATPIILACLSLGIADVIAGTTHYRWKDDRGNTVYSDRPPPKGVDYEVMSTGSSLKRVVPGDEGAVPLEVTPSASNRFTQVDENEANRSKKNAELCDRARINLETLENSETVKVRDQQGDERFLTAEEIIIEREKAKAQISVYCP